MAAETHCPLCAAPAAAAYHRDRRRPYLQCRECALVFVPPRYRPSLAEERAQYDLHDNRPDDPGYRAFLDRLRRPLAARLPAQATGLDFGCGPGPALAAMLREDGFRVDLYDSYYRPDRAVFGRSYDFICATEVVEHLYRPGEELQRLWSLLRPGGYLGVMTKLVRDVDAFSRWHYKNDVTHVCFFSAFTWRWWAGRQRAAMELLGDDVILLRRQPAAGSASKLS